MRYVDFLKKEKVSLLQMKFAWRALKLRVEIPRMTDEVSVGFDQHLPAMLEWIKNNWDEKRKRNNSPADNTHSRKKKKGRPKKSSFFKVTQDGTRTGGGESCSLCGKAIAYVYFRKTGFKLEEHECHRKRKGTSNDAMNHISRRGWFR